MNIEHCFNALVCLISKPKEIAVGEKLYVGRNTENIIINDIVSLNFRNINENIFVLLFSGLIE